MLGFAYGGAQRNAPRPKGRGAFVSGPRAYLVMIFSAGVALPVGVAVGIGTHRLLFR
jgi:hypothetical protein